MKISTTALVLVCLGVTVRQASANHYRAKCVGRGSDKHWPCWQMLQGSLNDATIDMYDGMSELYIEKGGKDFSVSEKAHGFGIFWNGGDRQLYYEGQGENNCYSLTLYASGDKDIHITSDDGVVASTQGAPQSRLFRSVHIPAICSKWAQVSVP